MRKSGLPSGKTEANREQISLPEQFAPLAPVMPLGIFRSLLNGLEVGVATVTDDGTITYANQRFAEIFGRPFRSIRGMNLSMYVSPASWPSLSKALKRGKTEAVSGTMEIFATELNKTDRIVRLSFSPVSSDGMTTIGVMATETTDQVQTRNALEKSEASLQTLSARMLQVQDEERRRVSRELHDSTGQEVAMVIMALDRAAREIEGAASKVLMDCTEQLRKVEGDIRTLSYVLHPPLLDEIGLGAALGWYLDGFTKRTGIEVDREIPDGIPRFKIEKETAIFRVIQESLTNVFRHSGSRRARVRLEVRPESIEACVEDEGRGFGDAGESGKQKRGVGLQSMQGRMEIVGGALEVQSNSKGTKIYASAPLEKSEQEAAQERSQSSESSSAAAKPEAKRVLIADDHDVARRGIRVLFEGQSDLEICGEASDGVEAVRRSIELKPDLVILDLSMPKMGGLMAAQEIRKASLGAKILVYTGHSVPILEKSARMAGCDGYVVKSDASRDLLRATREVLKGGTFYRSEAAKAKMA